ncbi:MAG: hypothetical protein OEZ59_14120 [Deltaproteobacteria bacterium]|nr:hypothetical protein [Deltaproteobacteria bacterium]
MKWIPLERLLKAVGAYDSEWGKGVASLNNAGAVEQDPASRGAANGVASLDGWGEIPDSEIPDNIIRIGSFCDAVSATQSIPNSTATKIQFASVTVGSFDTVNHRFKPIVGGTYEVTIYSVWAPSSTGDDRLLRLQKNGAGWVRQILEDAPTVGVFIHSFTALVVMNGTTDYLEGYVSQSSGAAMNLNSSYFIARKID